MADNGKYSIAVAVKTAYLAEQSDPSRNQYVFAYTITIANTGEVAAQLISRHWVITDAEHQVQEVKGAGRGRPAAAAAARRELRVHERHQPADGRRHDAGHLPDGRRGRSCLRRGHSAVHAFGAAHPALGVSVADRRRAAAAAASGPSSRPRRRRRSGAPPTLRGRTIPSCPDPFVRPPRARPSRRRRAADPRGVRHRSPRGGRRAPQPPRATPPPPPLPHPRRRSRRRCRRSIRPSRGARCRAGPRTSSPTSGPPSARAVRRSSPRPPPARSGSRRAPARTRSSPTDRNAVRAFFERHFSPYQVTAADGRDTGMITGYYEPLLAGSRVRSARHRVPLYARAGRSPHHRLDRALSRAEGQAAARPRRRQARDSVLAARRHRERQGAGRGHEGARLRRRSGRSLLPADPGLGPRSARRGRHDARRLRRSERPPVPLDRPRCWSSAAS